MNIKDNLLVLILIVMLLYVLPLFSPAAFLFWVAVPLILLRIFRLGGRTVFAPLCIAASGGFFVYPAGIPFFFIMGFIIPAFYMYIYKRGIVDFAERYQNSELSAVTLKIEKVSYKPVAFAPIPLTLLSAVAVFVFVEQKLAFQAGMSEYIYNSLSPLLDESARLDSKSQLAWVFNNRNTLAEYFVNSLPGLIYSTIALIFYFTEKLFYKPDAKDIFPLPDTVLALLVVSAGFFFAAGIKQNTGLYVIGGNGLVIASTLCFFRGLDVIAFHMKRKNLHIALRAVFYGLILMTQTLMLLVALLGIASVYIRMVDSGEEA